MSISEQRTAQTHSKHYSVGIAVVIIIIIIIDYNI